MSKHTEGPWVAQQDPDGSQNDYCVGVDGVKIDSIAVCDRNNARLIAAAPDLLAACQLFVEYDCRDHEALPRMMIDYNIARSAIRAAISKATGSPIGVDK